MQFFINIWYDSILLEIGDHWRIFVLFLRSAFGLVLNKHDRERNMNWLKLSKLYHGSPAMCTMQCDPYEVNQTFDFFGCNLIIRTTHPPLKRWDLFRVFNLPGLGKDMNKEKVWFGWLHLNEVLLLKYISLGICRYDLKMFSFRINKGFFLKNLYTMKWIFI